MRRDRTGSASAARDAGLRRVTRLTWQLAGAGAVCSALIAAAFGHGASASHAAPAPRTGPGPAARPNGTAPGSGTHGTKHTRQHRTRHPHHHAPGSGSGITIPAEPPAPASGAGQVTSGAS